MNPGPPSINPREVRSSGAAARRARALRGIGGPPRHAVHPVRCNPADSPDKLESLTERFTRPTWAQCRMAALSRMPNLALWAVVSFKRAKQTCRAKQHRTSGDAHASQRRCLATNWEAPGRSARAQSNELSTSPWSCIDRQVDCRVCMELTDMEGLTGRLRRVRRRCRQWQLRPALPADAAYRRKHRNLFERREHRDLHAVSSQ